MRDMILIFAVIAMLVFGYFVMKRLDRFMIDEKRKQIAVKRRKR